MKIIAKYLLILIVLGIYFIILLLSKELYTKDFITFLNVGNGDSILIGSKNEYILIDGGTSSYSLNKLYKYTDYKFPKSFIITHPHLDHLSGLIPILNYSDTYYDIYIAETFKSGSAIKKYFYDLDSFKYKPLSKGDVIYIGDLKLQVLWPEKSCDNLDTNYCSLVLSLTKNNRCVSLLLGDVTKTAQQSILHQVDGCKIIKVPHQGSDNALFEDLVKKVSPEYAIFSVGPNTYGHPDPDVVSFYRSIGSIVRRTDEYGDMTFYLD